LRLDYLSLLSLLSLLSPLSPLLVSTLAACASGAAVPDGALGGGSSKVDDPTCDGAHKDDNGVCRQDNGRFAPARCCDVASPTSFADECDSFDTHATDVCLPDDDAPADWPGCFAESNVTVAFAGGCCETAPGRDYLWCG